MNNPEKMTEMVQNNPKLKKRVIMKAMQLTESGEASDPEEAFSMAMKNMLGIDLPVMKLKAFSEGFREMDLKEMGAVAGGKNDSYDYLDPAKSDEVRILEAYWNNFIGS